MASTRPTKLPLRSQANKSQFALPSSSSSSTTSNRRPSSLSSSSSNNDDDDDDDTPLPFPATLPRSDFLAPDFQPAAYLSALPHRHQTLEDLRSDLRDRSATISAELLELVNTNYTAFLSLGSELRGGEEKTENVKVSLLGFQRAVREVKSKVNARREETSLAVEELKRVRAQTDKGRLLLELSERLSALEDRLVVTSLTGDQQNGNDAGWAVTTDDEDEDEDGLVGSSPAKLMISAKACKRIERLRRQVDDSHPFTIRLDERLKRCRNTLLLDLGNATSEAKKAGPNGINRLMGYQRLYRLLDVDAEAIRALRGS